MHTVELNSFSYFNVYCQYYFIIFLWLLRTCVPVILRFRMVFNCSGIAIFLCDSTLDNPDQNLKSYELSEDML